MWILHLLVSLWSCIGVLAQISLFDCPAGWEDFGEHCYKFTQSPAVPHAEAASSCREDGAYLLSVNSDMEHGFIRDTLGIKDQGQIKRNWWTSGQRNVTDPLQFYWVGDGEKIESYFYWHDDAAPSNDLEKYYIMYNFNGYEWGWILGLGDEPSPYVCKISKDESYRIMNGERGRDFGIESLDPEDIPFGPEFIMQPKRVIYEAVVYADSSIIADQTFIECRADSNPVPSYRWFKTRGGATTEIEVSTDRRYTFINGKLVINNPSSTREDDGSYECMATNEYGTIISNTVHLEFGYLQDFPKSPRSPITPQAYTWASIECNPPAHYPAVSYSWYKNHPDNYIQTSLKPYIFISNNGRLMFSEVTKDDDGEYYCVVTKSDTGWNSGMTSMPTTLKVQEGSPGEYDPKIPSDFPYVYPENPKVGDDVRIECWASGTSRPEQLEYFWTKVILDADGNKIKELPLPTQASMVDHNRVLNIPDVKLYDAGNYTCTCTRRNGGRTSTTKQLYLAAEPFFVLSLADQYLDEGVDLQWMCEADGLPHPEYIWYKNGALLQEQITQEDIANGRVSISHNALTIKTVDIEKDNGMYQCAARNIHAIRYSSAELKVMAFLPSFAKYPLSSNQFATIGGNTTIMCRPEAAPIPVIQWFKNKNPLNPPTDQTSRLHQLPNGNLVISPVQKSDAGHYACKAENPHGEAESQGNLTVLDSITITKAPEGGSVAIGDSKFIDCIASYKPQMDVMYTWYHGDMLVEFEKIFRLGEHRYQIWKNPYFVRGTGIQRGGLFIKRAVEELEGRYTCLVETTMGDEFRHHADITIVGPPSQPAGVAVVSYNASAAEIHWKASGANGSPINSYTIEAYNYWEKYWRVVAEGVKPEVNAKNSLMYTASDLRPFSQYQMRVSATNRYGTSQPSQPSGIFNTDSVKPDRLPTNIGGGGGKVGDLRINWMPVDPWEENGPGFGYRLHLRPNGVPEWDEHPLDIKGNVGEYVHLVGENNFYRIYEVMLNAYNDLGEGPRTNITRVRSAMGLPKATATNVRAQPFNATACRITWEKVENSREDIRGTLGGYKVAYWLTSWGALYENPWRVTYNGQMEEGMVIGLQPNTQYYFAVYVWNEAGNGPKSQWFQQRTLRSAPINQPVEVKVYRKSNSEVHAYWRGVSTTHVEEPLEGYMVRVWKIGENIKFAHDYNARKETDLKVEGLHPDITYKLRVFGYSRGGVGTMSSPAVTFMLGGASSAHVSVLTGLLALIMTMWSVS